MSMYVPKRVFKILKLSAKLRKKKKRLEDEIIDGFERNSVKFLAQFEREINKIKELLGKLLKTNETYGNASRVFYPHKGKRIYPNELPDKIKEIEEKKIAKLKDIVQYRLSWNTKLEHIITNIEELEEAIKNQFKKFYEQKKALEEAIEKRDSDPFNPPLPLQSKVMSEKQEKAYAELEAAQQVFNEEQKKLFDLYQEYIELYKEYEEFIKKFEIFIFYKDKKKLEFLVENPANYLGINFQNFINELETLLSEGTDLETLLSKGKALNAPVPARKTQSWFRTLSRMAGRGRGRTIKRKGNMGKPKSVKASKSKKATKSRTTKPKKIKRKSNKLN
jgi:hypothetical protein